PEDTDMDGDGVPNTSDAFPTDQAASKDSDGDGYPDEWNTGKSQTDSTTGLKLDAFPKDPTKWEEEKESNGNESFLFQKIGPLPLYAYLVIVIIGLAVGAGALKMKGGKSGGKAQKPEQSKPLAQQPTQPPRQQFQQPPPQ
ncbi:MAG: hypothetical protein KAU14_02295, partial [Thermoplasmata archaeon]|nr:hypothetical protein [Thermoplasmata archaeon]